MFAYTLTVNALSSSNTNNSVLIKKSTLIKKEKSFNEFPILPFGAKPILKSTLNREKEIINLISENDRRDLFGGKPKIFPDGIMDNYGENIELYEGDFSNQGQREYLFLAADGGTLHTDSIVRVYRQVQEKLIQIDLNAIIIKDIMHGYDLSNFYYWMPRPIAFVKNGKTYLRFMEYYSKDKPALICIYFWDNNKFTSINPKQCLH